MAILAITVGQVKFVEGEAPIRGTLGTTVTEGMLVYQDPDNNRIYPGNANQTSNGPAKVFGVVLNGGVDGGECSIQTDGIIDLGAGAAPVKGTFYILAGTDGGWAPVADLASGWWAVMAGVADENNQIRLAIENFGIRKA